MMNDCEVDRRDYAPEERAEIARALNYCIGKHMEFRAKSDMYSYDSLIHALDEDISQGTQRRTLKGIVKRICGFKRKNRSYSSDLTLEQMKNFRHLLSEEREMTQEVLAVTQDIQNVNNEFLNDLEARLVRSEQEWHSKWAGHSGYLEREALFQFPHRAQGALKSFLDIPAEKVRGVYFISMEDLWTYADYHRELSKAVLIKLGEVYRVDSKRGREGKRRLGYISFGAGGLPLSLANCALTCISNIGRVLGLDSERSYQLAGLSPKQVEEDNSAWGKKAQEIQANEGLYHEFED